jgi:hypothetical protein
MEDNDVKESLNLYKNQEKCIFAELKTAKDLSATNIL